MPAQEIVPSNIAKTSDVQAVQGVLEDIRSAPFMRVGFAEVGAGLQGKATEQFTLVQTGPGMAVNQTGGNLVIGSGTTANSETVIRSTQSFSGALLARLKTILSQRIANNTFRFELADRVGENLAFTINSATSVTVTFPTTNPFTSANVGQSVRLSCIAGAAGIPGRYAIASVSGLSVTFTVAAWPASGSGTLSLYGWNYIMLEYVGTSATNVYFDAQRRGWNSSISNLACNTTAGVGHVAQVAYDVHSAAMQDALSASASTFQWTNRGNRIENLPDPDVELYLFLVVQNGTTAPASNTNWTVGFVAVEDQGRNKVRVAGADPAALHAQPVQVMGGALSVSGGVTTTPTTPSQSLVNSLATTNATVVKASAGTIWSLVVSNANPAKRYLKLYNKATAPVVGTDVPVLTVPLPAEEVVSINLGSNGLRLSAGISFALTTGSADSDTAAVGASEIKVALAYT